MRLFEQKINRRNFIKRTIQAILSLNVLYIFSSLLSNKKEGNTLDEWYEAGDINNFKNNHIYPYSSAHFYLSKIENGGMLAISTKCTHLGCAVQFNQSKDMFVCPCHASAFSKYGEVVSPPATRALDIYPISIQDNKVMVNVTKPIKRQKYEASQLTYA
ncbi:QcrA and Rieske domain-containing protein [Aureibacter tunicatorum]|uniref:Rieske Fe-S protein n=1 Tax=Aureibacter tunicatorum TaxID=866807 RepID=A0AAE3XSC8_9BACT|nr:ubiquinol-cytochrome c reductase iron-sulfur subunit [Aureibacter tunicatorum]MDR6240634.1 Rieske Fe-S protein [Aureibacter tunicatorum]BDD06505.1 cytochrome b6-f complex iron-sulfur subunit [Aureibacter tunicatorum]